MIAYYKILWTMPVSQEVKLMPWQCSYEAITHSATAADILSYLLSNDIGCSGVRIEAVEDTDWPF